MSPLSLLRIRGRRLSQGVARFHLQCLSAGPGEGARQINFSSDAAVTAGDEEKVNALNFYVEIRKFDSRWWPGGLVS